MNPAPSRPKRRRSYQKSGVYTLKKAVAVLGSRALPGKRTALGRALHEWRTALIADLGGDDGISTQQRALVELAVRTKLLVDSIDAYVLGMESPVDRRHRRLWPVVRERQSLVAQLQALLRDLGFERRSQPIPDLHSYLAWKETASKGDAAPKKDEAVCAPLESRPSLTLTEPFSSSSSLSNPKKDAFRVLRP